MRCVVIGGSAGSNEALRDIYGRFDLNCDCAVVVCQHIPASMRVTYRNTFALGTSHPVKEAEEKESLTAGMTYLAPGGYHLLIEKDGTFSLNVDAPVLYARPSIDVLFETAAEAFGSQVIGVLLTGANADGAQGLKKIKEYGGTSIVQTPESCVCAEMPSSVLHLFSPDHVLTPEEIGKLLSRLCKGAANAI